MHSQTWLVHVRNGFGCPRPFSHPWQSRRGALQPGSTIPHWTAGLHAVSVGTHAPPVELELAAELAELLEALELAAVELPSPPAPVVLEAELVVSPPPLPPVPSQWGARFTTMNGPDAVPGSPPQPIAPSPAPTTATRSTPQALMARDGKAPGGRAVGNSRSGPRNLATGQRRRGAPPIISR